MKLFPDPGFRWLETPVSQVERGMTQWNHYIAFHRLYQENAFLRLEAPCVCDIAQMLPEAEAKVP